jgi:hypothetical protein
MLNAKKINFSDSKEMQSFFKSEKELADPSFVFYRLKNAAKKSKSNSLEKIIRKTAIYYELNINDYYTAGRLYKLIGDIRFRRGHFYEAQSYYYLAYKNYTRNETHEAKTGAADMSFRCAQINEKLQRYELARQNYFTAYKLFSKVNMQGKEEFCLSKDITLLAIILIESGLRDKPVKYMEYLLSEISILAKIIQRDGDKLSAAYIYKYVGMKQEIVFGNYELAKLNYFIASRLFEDLKMLREAAEMNIKCGDLELSYGSFKKTFNDYMIAAKQFLAEGDHLRANIIVGMYVHYLLAINNKKQAVYALLRFNKIYIEKHYYSIAADNLLKCVEYEGKESAQTTSFLIEAASYYLQAGHKYKLVGEFNKAKDMFGKAKDVYFDMGNTLEVKKCELFLSEIEEVLD